MSQLLVENHSNLFIHQYNDEAQVTVCISLYNYQDYIVETLESVYQQNLADLDLIIVDDCSTDWSSIVTKLWLEQKYQRFNQVSFIKHTRNAGLSLARNTAINLAQTPFVFILDADNLLYPRCIRSCLEVLQNNPEAAFAYPLLAKFGESHGIMGNLAWSKSRLAKNNYIDAMSLIRREALLTVNGYSSMPFGWEDYDLWCKFIEQNYYGILVPEILAKYRVHGNSMLNTTTNQPVNLVKIIGDLKQRHPWLEISTNSLSNNS